MKQETIKSIIPNKPATIKNSSSHWIQTLMHAQGENERVDTIQTILKSKITNASQNVDNDF